MIDLTAERAFFTPYVNSSLLLPLLLSLAKDKHTPETATSFKLSYDYIIVGAGSGGSTLASRLSELQCVSVLLLEAGGKPPLLNDVPLLQSYFLGSKIDWKHETVPQKYTGYALPNRTIMCPSGFGLGGSSLLNGMIYVRGNKHDYNNWAANGADGWSYEEVLPYFLKSEDNLNPKYVANGYHHVGGLLQVEKLRYHSNVRQAINDTARDLGYRLIDSNYGTQTGFDDHQLTSRIGQRCSTAKAFLVPAENRKNLDIVANAYVKRVVIDGTRATGVLVDIDGKPYEIQAKQEVILAAGAIHSAQLLLLSGIGPRDELNKHNISVIKELNVGENLQDHASATVDFVLDKSLVPTVSDKTKDSSNILQYIHNRTGILTSAAGINFMVFSNNADAPPVVDLPTFQLHILEKDTEKMKSLFPPGPYRDYYNTYDGLPMISCYVNTLPVKSRGTVKLQSTNPYDMPLIDPNYFADPRDLDVTVEGMKLCYRIGTSKHMKKLGSRPLWTAFPGCEDYELHSSKYYECRARSIVHSLTHLVGTAKMGRIEDPSTVVDSKLRVKGIEGLRVSDAGVMPVVPSGNTNAPTIMIAEKLSDIIKESIQCIYK